MFTPQASKKLAILYLKRKSFIEGFFNITIKREKIVANSKPKFAKLLLIFVM